MSFSVGETVGAYRILAELGRGGMGQVFQVEHTLTQRLEAMKVLEGGRPDAPDQAARSLREIQVQARLDHPNIAAVHHAFWAGQDLILVMELIEGCSLRVLLERGRIPVTTAIDYAGQALAALSYAHAQGVIHRDVSPSNMMVSSKGVLKLTDFGLSKGAADLQLSRPGAPVGSLYYMPPEQVRGSARISAQSDIYSLGAVLYEMTTGKRPFEGESAYSIMVAQVEQAPIPPIDLAPGLPPAINQAILRALAKEPTERFSSAADFRQVLTPFKATVSVSRPILDRAVRRYFRSAHPRLPAMAEFRRAWAFGTVAAVALAMIGAVGVSRHLGRHRLNSPPPSATVNPIEPVPEPSVATTTVEPVLIQAPEDSVAPRRVPPKRRARPPVTMAAAADAPEPASAPTPSIKNFEPQPNAERPVARVPEPKLVMPDAPPVLPETAPAIQTPGVPQVSFSPDVEVGPRPGSKGLKTGISKLWRFMRGRKSSSENDPSAATTEHP